MHAHLVAGEAVEILAELGELGLPVSPERARSALELDRYLELLGLDVAEFHCDLSQKTPALAHASNPLGRRKRFETTIARASRWVSRMVAG